MTRFGIEARMQLEQRVLPFWLRNGIDEAYGGFHTCFDNRGRRRVSDDKFTWSQGRFVWLLARAATMVDEGSLGEAGAGAATMRRHATAGARFLLDHAVRVDGTCAFALTRDGASAVRGQPERSVYADLFAAMGFAELARCAGDADWLEPARAVVARAAADVAAGTAPTPPYRVPAGHRAFGPQLILLNALVVLGEAERAVGEAGRHDEAVAAVLERVMSFHDGRHGFAEMPAVAGSATGADSLILRHRVPGHALEAMWIALDAMALIGDDRHRETALASIAPLCALGWDDERGGLFRYTDEAGGEPRGSAGDSDYERLVRGTWDTKLWWVHTEASAATAIAAGRHGRDECRQWAERIWRYTLDTFPAGEDGEEWIQIRDRDGSPRDEVVALPVKDPFHIARNLMQLITLDHP